MSPPVTCKRCMFQVAVGLDHLGHLASFAPDQAKMMKRCKRAGEPDFAYDCSDLTSALLATLENAARRPLAGLRHGADDIGDRAASQAVANDRLEGAPDELSAANDERANDE
jgi:hypothetical protein